MKMSRSWSYLFIIILESTTRIFHKSGPLDIQFSHSKAPCKSKKLYNPSSSKLSSNAIQTDTHKMAVSALILKTPNLHALQSFNPNKSFFTTKPSFSSSSSSSCSSNADNAKLSTASTSATKKRVFDIGIGLLAASILCLSPLDANATRVEYYATVEEPSCELNFARSGLGYCDVVLGSGVEAPYSELINVRFNFLLLYFCNSCLQCFAFLYACSNSCLRLSITLR